MSPPKEEIDRMLAKGQRGVLSSIICLAACVAVQRGERAEDIKVESAGMAGLEFTSEQMAFIKASIVSAAREFAGDPPESLVYSIALYRAHLKAAGFVIEEGMTH